MNVFKSTLFLGFVTLSAIAHASIFPGSTITLNSDLRVTKAIATRDWGSAEAVFENGKRIQPKSEASSANEVVCQLLTSNDDLISKGTYTYDGNGHFLKFGPNRDADEAFRINCIKSWDNTRAHNFPLNSPVESTPEVLVGAIGGNAVFNFAVPEKFSANGIVLSTGKQMGKEVDLGGYAGPICGYSIFKVGNSLNISLTSDDSFNCLMKIERSDLANNVLTLSGKQRKYNADCSLRFRVVNGKLASNIVMENDYNNNVSMCFLK